MIKSELDQSILEETAALEAKILELKKQLQEKKQEQYKKNMNEVFSKEIEYAKAVYNTIVNSKYNARRVIKAIEQSYSDDKVAKGIQRGVLYKCPETGRIYRGGLVPKWLTLIIKSTSPKVAIEYAKNNFTKMEKVQ